MRRIELLGGDRRIAWTALGVVVVAPLAMACSQDDGGRGDAAALGPESGADAGSMEDAAGDASSLEDGKPPCSDDGFCRTIVSSGQFTTLSGIFAATKDRVLATSSQGTIFLWNGVEWRIISLGYAEGSLSGIWASGPDQFWVGKTNGRPGYQPPPASASILSITLNGDQARVVEVAVPDGADCARGFSISGTSESDVYLTAYCIDQSDTYQPMNTGRLFHRGADGVWSLLWVGGAADVEKVALGAVYAVKPGEAWAVGWRSGPYGDDYATPKYFVPGFFDPSDPGTRTIVLHVENGVTEEEELDLTLAMCAKSVWSSGAEDSLFIAGTCDGYNITIEDAQENTRQFTTVARKAKSEGGGAGWVPMVQAPLAAAVGITRLSAYPFAVWGFADTEVYLAGTYVQRWDGSRLRFVHLDIDGALYVSTSAIHGISTDDVWIAGGNSVMHRGRIGGGTE